MLKQKLDMGDKTLKYRWLKTKFESIGKKKSENILNCINENQIYYFKACTRIQWNHGKKMINWGKGVGPGITYKNDLFLKSLKTTTKNPDIPQYHIFLLLP